jgi:uncharacterized membrane protein/uncharacterized protein YegL
MDWIGPYFMLLFIPAVALLWWFHRGSLRPMAPWRQRALLVVRSTLVLLVLIAIAGPAIEALTDRQAVIFLLDHSQSQGESGMKKAYQRMQEMVDELPSGTLVGVVSAGEKPIVHRAPSDDHELPVLDYAEFRDKDDQAFEDIGGRTDIGAAVSLAAGLFPQGATRRIVYLGDGNQTHGDLEAAVRVAHLLGLVFDAVPIAGDQRSDVRVARLVSDKSRSHEGETIKLSAEIESSLAGEGVIRLFENGVEVEKRPLKLEVGQQTVETFNRMPEERNLYTYRVRLEGFDDDAIRDNDEAMTLVDVRGRPLLLYVEGESTESHYLREAMAHEGIRLHARPVHSFPESLQDLGGYDGIVLSDVPARQLSTQQMELIRDYVEQLGGGFLMVGGKNSFGVGGYYRTPIEEILPVKLKAPDQEIKFPTALCLVIDRSGSMSGQKVEICKTAASATVELLAKKDYVGVVCFSGSAQWIVPMTRATNKSAINSQIATINAGGGTNIHPGMTEGHQSLSRIKTKVKHMIVLTDGHTNGSGYQQLAAQMNNEGITISTVAVGASADVALLQTIAAAGGGKFYQTVDPTNIPSIFTQDAMTHMGRLIREQSFSPRQSEAHIMLKGCRVADAPQLLGYVKTNRRPQAQVPLVTDIGDPLLAHWQFGLGKVTAFTSDCKSRWAALWLTNWPAYNQFWAQVLRETCRRPQSHNMDIRIEQSSQRSQIVVDVLEDAARFKNDALVEADVYFVAAGSLGSSMELQEQTQLVQTGPGRYEGSFLPKEPGVYLVRARSGNEMVSAGQVHNISGETATGRVNENLLTKACEISGGRFLSDPDSTLPSLQAGHSHFVELTPLLLKLFLILFLADVAIRRWENVQSMISLFRRTG